MWKRVLFVLLITFIIVLCKPNLYNRFEQLQTDTKNLLSTVQSDDSTSAHHIKSLKEISNDIYSTLKQFYGYSTPDLVTYETTYDQLLQKYNDVKQKLGERAQANKQEYIDMVNKAKETASVAKDAVHHYVDEIAPNTHIHDNKPTEPSLYDKVLKHAKNMYEKAKNTVEIGSDKHVTIDSITYNAKKYHKQLQHIDTLDLTTKLNIATELTKLQQQISTLIEEGKANTSNFNQFESTKQLIIDSQNILKNDDSKIYSQTITAKMTDTITKATDSVKHTVDSIKQAVIPSTDTAKSTVQETTTGGNSITDTITGSVNNIVTAAKQQFNDLTGTTTQPTTKPDTSSLFGTITSKWNEYTGNKAVPEHVDNTVIGYVKRYYTGLYQRLISTINNLTGKKTIDAHSNPIDDVLSFLGINKAVAG